MNDSAERRMPTPSSAIRIFRKIYKKRLGPVLDVGVQVGTDFLMNELGDLHHVLFEPVQIYHEHIRKRYTAAGISFDLIPVAVGSTSGTMFQHVLSADLSGRATHSQLLEKKTPEIFGAKLLEIAETQVLTLDEWLKSNQVLEDAVLKIDVDGLEDEILAGGERLLERTVMLVIEAHMSKVGSRTVYLESKGFRLFDIVGHGYYMGQAQQVDLVFLKNDVFENDIDFRPWEKATVVNWQNWEQLA
jgi:FkbM family methyltransferase